MSLCKVEFNQPSCWLYFVPNLHVIQYLETLYLDGNHVKIVCERVWRKAQKCATQQSLTTRSRNWLTAGKLPKQAHMWSIQGSWRVTLAVALQDKSHRLARQLTHDSVKLGGQVASPPCFGKTDLSDSKHT